MTLKIKNLIRIKIRILEIICLTFLQPEVWPNGLKNCMYCITIKGSVSRDFLPLVFSTIRTHLGPWIVFEFCFYFSISPWYSITKFEKFDFPVRLAAELDSAMGCTPWSQTDSKMSVFRVFVLAKSFDSIFSKNFWS